MNRRKLFTLASAAVSGGLAESLLGCASKPNPASASGLWGVWDSVFAHARYVSLSHVLTKDSPLWDGFPHTTAFRRGLAKLDENAPLEATTYETMGFETTSYTFATDQFGTQLDPPAHWHQCFPAIDELPPTLALRKLAIISIAEQVEADPSYSLTVDDVRAWESVNGAVPADCVVMVRSDWSKRWPDKARFVPADGKFPGVSLEALQFLHLERRILFHGHEPLDTDNTPTLEGEDWLMNNGYMQAEGVANLDQAPARGALIAIGFPRFKGGTGGFASFTAICPEDWSAGVAPGEVADAPFAINERRLIWNNERGYRERTATCDKKDGELSFN